MRKRERIIQIRVTEEEYQIISQNAQEKNMQVAPYIRMVAQNPYVHYVDYSLIAKHTEEIAKVRTEINQLIWTIEASNNYLPKEIETIVELMKKIFDAENKVLRFFTNSYRESLHQMIMDNGRSRDGGEEK